MISRVRGASSNQLLTFIHKIKSFRHSWVFRVTTLAFLLFIMGNAIQVGPKKQIVQQVASEQESQTVIEVHAGERNLQAVLTPEGNGEIRLRFKNNKEENCRSFSFKNFIGFLRDDDIFLQSWVDLFKQLPFDYPGFYFETPPLTTDDLDHEFECRFIYAPKFKQFKTMTGPFQDHFSDEGATVHFRSLKKDALLIVPNPIDKDLKKYTHIGAFMTSDLTQQKLEFWKYAAAQVDETIKSGQRIWLNTEGSGVYYLHLRLDSRPKYYHYVPYKNPEYWNDKPSC